MNKIVSIVMSRDDLDRAEAEQWLKEARDRVVEGDDPEDVLLEEFGLEPDYIFDLLE